MHPSAIRLALLSAGTLALAVACGGGAPGTSTAPTLPALPSIALPSIALPSINIPTSFSPDAGLEDLFPDTIGGNAIDPASAQGEGVYALFGNSEPEEFNAFVTGLGANISQVSAALSFNLWPGPTEGDFTGITIAALRVQGVESARTVAGFAELVREDVQNAQIGPQVVGGKSVTGVTNPEDANENVYLYGVGDVVFVVGGTPAHVEEAFTKLP